ncbi:MAG: ATP-binding protein [Chloroflexota bacterium]|nr:ATP-binding protein [Chloroflexota bacterium]
MEAMSPRSTTRALAGAALVGVLLAAALAIDLTVLVSTPTAALYAVPLLVAALIFSPRVVAGFGALAVILHLVAEQPGAIEPAVWPVYAASLLALAALAVLLAAERERSARRTREAEHAADRTARLQVVTAAFSEAITPGEVAAVVVEQGVAALGAQAGFIAALTTDGAEFEMVRTVGYPDGVGEQWERFPVTTPVPISDAVRTGEPIWIESSEVLQARYPHVATPDAIRQSGAWAALPLIVEGRALGAMGLKFARARPFSSEDRAFMLALARQCAQALERTRLYEAERTARSEAEATERRYRGIFENAGDALVVARDGYVLDANPAACALLGYGLDELRGQPLATFVVTRPAWIEAQRQCIAEEGQWRGEVEWRRKDGSIVPVEVTVRRVELPAGAVELGVGRDISQRRALERMQQDFVAMATHELMTPITALKGFAQIAQHGGMPWEQATASIVTQADHLSRLVGDLLDVARLESGRLALWRSEVDLAALARSCTEHARAMTPTHPMVVEAPARMPVGWWDRDRLGQILANLLSNAVKYSPDGGEILIRVEDRGGEARITVRDAGVGVTPDDLPRLFDRFYRVETGRNGARGLGLGLYIARSLAEAHGGRIWATSAGPGRGSTFTVALPYGEPPPDAE